MNSISQKLNAILGNGVKAGVPGVSVVIANSSGILWKSHAGEANVQEHLPINKYHIFGVGSITKVFITVVTLQLVEEGVLRMSDTTGSILEALVIDGIPNASTATISELTSHTSGIPTWEFDPRWIREGRGIDCDPLRIWGKTDTLEYIRKPSGERDPPIDNASKKFPFSYSNTNFTILGLIIEKVTGNTAESEIRKRILIPLNLTSTYLEGFEEPQPDRLPHRYHYATSTFRQVAGISPCFPEVKPGLIDASSSNLSVEWAAGGLVSNAQDLSRFALALKNGELLNEESTQIMRDWKPIGEPSSFMGHGLFRYKKNETFLCGHGGSVLGFTGAFFWAEDTDLAIAVCANVGTMHVGEDVPSAGSIINDPELLELALELTKHI